MSKRSIDGITITLSGEHEDGAGYLRCDSCKGKVALVSPPGPWMMDSEAFKDGEEIPDDEREEVYVGEVSGHWCETCRMLTSISYNFEG